MISFNDWCCSSFELRVIIYKLDKNIFSNLD